MQKESALKIKEVLNENIDWMEEEAYQPILIEIAKAYNDMFYANVKRYLDFFMVPGGEEIDRSWDKYNDTILIGLKQSTIDQQSKYVWTYIANERESRCNDTTYKEQFLKRMQETRREARKKASERYWQSHPELVERKQVLRNRKQELEMEIHESARILENLKKEKEPYDFEIESANERLVRIQKQVSRLEKRIWWKSRAQQQIMDLSKKEEWLKSEINGKMQKVNPIEIQIGICEKRVQEMRREVSACVIEVAEIERSAVDV